MSNAVELSVDQEWSTNQGSAKPLVIACGAIAKELIAILDMNQARDSVEIQCLPAIWHNTPDKIPGGVRAKIEAARADDSTRPVYVAFADCGTGGLLDKVLEDYPDIAMLPGAHCYAFFAGLPKFDAMMDQEIGTFFLTDFLARHFRKFVWEGFGLDRSPDMLPMMFGNYKRIIYLAQQSPPPYLDYAQEAAELLGLRLEVVDTGYGLMHDIAKFAAGELPAR